jgi:hypothetical protein
MNMGFENYLGSIAQGLPGVSVCACHCHRSGPLAAKLLSDAGPCSSICNSEQLATDTLPCSCNKATGEPTSMCWVDKPDGAICRPELYGDQPVPAFPITHVCRSGDCVEIASTKPSEPTLKVLIPGDCCLTCSGCCSCQQLPAYATRTWGAWTQHTARTACQNPNLMAHTRCCTAPNFLILCAL